MSNGFISLHRQILDWEWWDDEKTLKLFLYLLLTANHADKKWRGIIIKRGELVTSYAKLSEKSRLSVRSVRTSIKRLKTTCEVTCTSTSKYTVISIKNYDKYQTPTRQTTNQRQTNDKPTTTNNNDNNYNNYNKRIDISKDILADAKKIPNSLILTKGQVIAFAKEFRGLTSSEIEEQRLKCNTYMNMSSSNYNNPGLFFKGWLKKYHTEKINKQYEDKKMQEILHPPMISDEQMQRNRERIADIKSKLLDKIGGVN